MIDLGHCRETTVPRAQTSFRFSGSCPSRVIHAQFRSFTKPLDRQTSHFHAAGEENWKWNATRSFFFRLPLIRSLGEWLR
jgi:hypothetical protein